MPIPKRRISIDFVDFWSYFDKTDNFLYHTLSQRFDVAIHDRPQLLFCSDKGHHHKLYACKKIFFTAECLGPQPKHYDYHLTCFHGDHPHHLRLPYYVIAAQNPEDLIKRADDRALESVKRQKFCCFVSGNNNPKDPTRLRLFKKLCEYKKVDSGGTILNNIGGPIPPGNAAKLAFLEQYKFNLCFENTVHLGYTTEKLYDAMHARCIPLYGGNPAVEQDFNPKSFLNYHDFSSEDAFIEKVIELDRDDECYLTIAREPYYTNNRISPWFSSETLLDFIENALDSTDPIISQRSRWHKLCRWTLAKRDKAPN